MLDLLKQLAYASRDDLIAIIQYQHVENEVMRSKFDGRVPVVQEDRWKLQRFAKAGRNSSTGVWRASAVEAARPPGCRTALVQATVAQRLTGSLVEPFQRQTQIHGYDLDAWRERMRQPGLFQSGAVGAPSARAAYAQEVGKKWIADKTS